MTIPNRISLDDLYTMPVREIAALPADQLALLKQDADERLRAAKALSDWLDGAIARKYGERVQEARRNEGKNTGTIRLQDGGVTVIADLPKRIDWDQDRLAEMVERIREAGGDPTQYVDIAYKVPERKYAAWPDVIRIEFEPARTVRPGTLKVTLEPNEAMQ